MTDIKKVNNPEGSQDGFVIDAKKTGRFLEKEHTEPRIKSSGFSWILILLGALVVIILSGLFLSYRWYNTTFEKYGGADLGEIYEMTKRARNFDPFEDDGVVAILVAGVDEVKNQRDESTLTDTLMIVTINPEGEVKLLSIPRDLWIESLKTKINALYYYGEESPEISGKELLVSVLDDITGLSIDNMVLLKMDMIKEIVDALGGLEINVERAFVDNLYPRDNVSQDLDDPSLLYETVSFESGVQKMNGETVVQFMRSRHSEDELEGTDEGRTARQQLVVKSLLSTLRGRQIWMNPETAGRLYKTYEEDIESSLPLSDLVAMILHLDNIELQFKQISLPVTSDDRRGILRVNKSNSFLQWVYEPEDETWDELRGFVRQNILD